MLGGSSISQPAPGAASSSNAFLPFGVSHDDVVVVRERHDLRDAVAVEAVPDEPRRHLGAHVVQVGSPSASRPAAIRGRRRSSAGPRCRCVEAAGVEESRVRATARTPAPIPTATTAIATYLAGRAHAGKLLPEGLPPAVGARTDPGYGEAAISAGTPRARARAPRPRAGGRRPTRAVARRLALRMFPVSIEAPSARRRG